MKKKIQILLSFLCLLSASALISTGAQALELGEYAAPCITLQGVESDGTEMSRCLADPAANMGQKRYAILKFFSIVCPACHASHATFVKLFNSRPDLLQKAAIHYIGLNKKKSDMLGYVNEKSGELSQLEASFFFGRQRDVVQTFKLQYTPTLYVVDRHPDEHGKKYKVVFKFIGAMDENALPEFINSMK